MNEINSKSNFSTSRISEQETKKDKLNKSKETTGLKKYLNIQTPIKKRGSLAPPVLSTKTLMKVREENSDKFNNMGEVNA